MREETRKIGIALGNDKERMAFYKGYTLAQWEVLVGKAEQLMISHPDGTISPMPLPPMPDFDEA